MEWVRCSAGNGAESLSGLFNDFVSGMRADSRSVDFRERVKNYRRSVSKNYKSLMDYVSSVFVRHEKVQVLRVRLSYASQGAMGVSIKTAGRHRQALLKELSRGRLGPLLGYAWRFGWDGSMGWCNDVLIFMSPCLSKTDIELVEFIGRLWGSKITGGVGVYYNFNESKKEGGLGGLGVVRSMDVIGMEGVRKMAVYMTKIDDYFKLSVAGVRSFGKGGL